MAKKAKILLISIIALIAVIGCGILYYVLAVSKPIWVIFSYSGYKKVEITNNVKAKIPEGWQVGNIDDMLCIHEVIEGEEKIYFVQGEAQDSPLYIKKDFIHPVFGNIKLQNELKYWSYSNLGQGLYHGEFLLENGELKEMYTISYAQEDFYLLSYEPVDQKTVLRIFYSIF